MLRLIWIRPLSLFHFSSPRLIWDAIVKMSETELELISDIGMHLFIEKGKRGGISCIAKKHSKANNKYMKCYEQYKIYYVFGCK